MDHKNDIYNTFCLINTYLNNNIEFLESFEESKSLL